MHTNSINQTQLIQHQNEVFIALIIHFIELSIIGVVGGLVSYVLDYYIRTIKDPDNHPHFDLGVLLLNGILGGFASFIVLSIFPIDSINLLIGVSALSGLSSVPLLTTLKSLGLDYIIQKIFGNNVVKQQNQNNDKTGNK